MSSYSERLDGVLDFVENYGVSASTDGFDKADSRAKAKQAIASLIKELVAEARIDELEHTFVSYDDALASELVENPEWEYGQVRERIAELKQELESYE